MNDLDYAKFCFIPDEKEVFVISEITQRDAAKRELIVTVAKTRKILTIKYDNAVPIGSMEELDNPPTDLIKLVYVNRPGILHTLRTRFIQEHIYTSIGPILVALNPFKWIAGIYEEDVMKTYKSGEANLSDRPHVFAVSNDAYNDLQYGQNQSLIISGESGAGKTEATKQCLSYLAFLAGSASGIQSKILKASPILEAWGNAKTLRNNNSSRFGKFIEIWFDSNCTISGSSNTTYILEKSRVVFQEKDERNYHVFYQLLKGATPQLLAELELTDIAANPTKAFYINQSGCIDIDNVDDAADFQEVNDAFRDVGFSADDQRSLYTIVAGILHLGNVVYVAHEENPDESVITPESHVWLERAARRLGVEVEFVKKALLYKMIRSGNARRTSVAFAPYKLDAAYENKNALAKEIYKRCFDFIVGKINALMDNDRDKAVNMIGILDIFGFEIFQKNSFEQLCINLANEALQQHFNYNIFQAEMNIYRAEDVPLPPLEYKDNQDVLDLIVKKPLGLIPMLDEEGLVPRGSWEGFLSKYTKQHGKHARFKKSKHAHELGIVHYAGDVSYDATLFLVKNKDTLSADLVDVFSMSELPLLKSFFTESDEPAASGDAGNSGKRPGGNAQSGAKMTVGRSFSVQLEKLITDLNTTKPRYIRCIKPNQVKKPNIFVPDLTNEQLTYSGVFEAVIIMQNGYPFRQPHVRFREQYHMLVRDKREHRLLFDAEAFQLYAFTSVLPEESTSIASEGDDATPGSKAPRPFTRDQCMFLVRALAAAYPGRDLDGCYPGITRTFYRAQQHNALLQLRTEIMAHAALRLQTAARAFIARRLCRQIRQAESEWFSSLSSRSVEKIYPAAERVDSLVARLNRAVPKIGFELDCARIGQLYGKAFASEDQLAPAIKAALDGAGDILEKYDRLEVMLKSLDTVNFNVKYRTLTLSFKWEEKRELMDYAEQIRAMGKLVRVKRKFRSGIAGRNEVALEEAMRELTVLQDAGALAGEDNFCVEECVQAQKIIVEAEELFARLLTTVAGAIESGRFTCTAADSGTGLPEEVQINVDASALSAVVAEHERELRSKPVNSLPPMRVRALQLLCRQLRDLRTLAKERQWDAVWRELQQYWNLPTNATTEQLERSGFAHSEPFLPVPVRSSLLDEKRAISLVAIRNFVVPQVQGAIDCNTVPSVPTLGTGALALDTSELSSQVASADVYAEYFDEGLDTFIAVAKEHLHYRTEVASGDWGRIAALLSRGTSIPATHPDRAHVRNFVKVFELVTTLKTRIVEDRVTGDPGAFEFTALQTVGLTEACAIAAGLKVAGGAWVQLLTAANVLRITRAFLQQEQFAEAWEYMQSLSSDAAWQTVVSAVAQQVVDPIIADALSSAVGELKSYELEILHARAMKDIAAALAQGGIDDETSDYSTSGVSSNALQGELDVRSPQLIPTSAAKQLVDDCKTVIRLRALVLTSQWGEIERVLTPLYEKTESFQTSHPSCQTELQRCYNRVFDLKVRAQLQAALATGQITVVERAEGHVCDTEAVDVTTLKSSIEFSQEGFILGTTTKAIQAEACGLYCLRSALLQDVWEPPTRFFFGNTSTANLAGKVALLESDASLAKARASIPTILAALNRLAVDAPLESVARAMAKASANELSVVEVLNHLRRTLPVSSPLQQEVASVATLCNERRCLLLLLLSASTGRVSGSLDDFHTGDVETVHIESALQVVAELLASLGTSPVVQNWVQAARYLLSVRQTIQQATAQAPEAEPNLSDVFSVQSLQDVISSTTPGFPLQELKLILNKLRDQTSFQELLQALSFGKPVFEDGKVDVYRIQHLHLQERLEAAKKNVARSDRLDRLFFYVELTIRLRTAIALGQWELSDRDRANTEGASAMITVKRCLREFEQARRFFSSPIEGVPPDGVVAEFTLIGREWERRLVKQRFATAFKVGAVTGTPLALTLTDLRTDLLDGEVARMKEAQSAASEKDESFEQYMRAGNELVTIRREATKVHASYKAAMKFAFPSDSLHTILDAQDFIPDAITRALAMVDRCASASYRFAEEWEPINSVLVDLQGCPAVPATQQEVQLVTAEAQDRVYLANTLDIFTAAQSLPIKPRAQQELIDQLVAHQAEYDQLKGERHAAAVATAKASGGGRLIFGRRAHSVKQSATLELVHTSAVVLLHYLRALKENTFDPLARDWKDDKNFSKTPRLLTMAQNLDASYSMQQVLRSAQRVVLHPRVQALVYAAAKRLDDAISQQEMLVAFTDAQYVLVGDVDGLKPAAGSVVYMQGVNERIAKVGVDDAAVQKMHAYFVVHQQLRDSIQSRDFQRAFAVLDDFLGNGKRDLAFVLEVLSNKNYQVVKEAAAEFQLLVAVICDRAWQCLAERAVVQDRIRGRRGALHTSTIGWREIDRALQVLESLPAVSTKSRHLSSLCTMVKGLRRHILGDGAHVVHEGESESGLQRLQFAQNRPDVAMLAAKVIAMFAEQVVATACHRVEGLTAVNLTWAHIDDLGTFSQRHVQPIVDAANLRVDGDLVLSVGYREELLAECDVVNRHCESLQAGMALEAALQTTLVFTFSNEGLSMRRDLAGQLMRTYAGATAQRWQLLGHPEEYWWACLTALAKSFQGLMDQAASAGAQDVLVLRPGTELFKTLLPTMYALIAQVNNINLQLKASGYRKRQTLPLSILDACDRMRTAIAEHNILTRLERIITADRVDMHVTEDTNMLKIEVQHVRPVLQIDKDDDLPYGSTYELYGTELKSMVLGARLSTTLGKLLIDMLVQLVELRVAIATKRWHLARQRCGSFQWLKEFATCPDIDVCSRFLRYKEYHRAIESAILCCSLPNVLGWSLHAASREIAQSINDTPLRELLLQGQTKYGNLAVQYLSISQLLALGEQMLAVVILLRKGLWVGALKYSDEISGGVAGPGSRYISAECRDAPEALRALVAASHTLEGYMKAFVLQTASNLETELTAVQLEHQAQKTLRSARLTGKPGEIILQENVLVLLQEFGTLTASSSDLAKRCAILRAAVQAASILTKIVDAHIRGDLPALMRLVDLLYYLSEIDCSPGAVSPAGFPPSAVLTDEELLKVDDALFAHQALAKATPSTLATVGQGPLMTRLDTSHRDSLLGYWDPANAESKDELQKTFVRLTGYAFTDAVVLRDEVQDMLTLLHRHLVVESMHAEYFPATEGTNAANQEPGALDLSLITTDNLTAFVEKYARYYASDAVLTPNRGNLMMDLVTSLLIIRQGQLNNDVGMISVGLEQVRAACTREHGYVATVGSVPFGGTVMQGTPYFEHIAEEVELADQDLVQRKLIVSLKEALATRGIPTSHYPFDISGIYVAALEKAYVSCNEVIPACAEARYLYQAASILLVLRKYALRRDWTAMLEFYENLHVEDLEHVFQDAFSAAEHVAAKEVMYVSRAVGLAIEGYITGYIGGTVGAIAPCGELFLNHKDLRAALDVFEALDQDWLSTAVMRHFNTTKTLYAIRFHAVARNWDAVLEAAEPAMKGLADGTRPLVEICIPEVELARDHAAYVISLEQARLALNTGALRGHVGDVHTWQVEIDTLMRSYARLTSINCCRSDILKLKCTLEFLFRVRQAILLDQWITPDHTHDYLHLLGSNFHLQDERTQQRNLYARLVDLSTAQPEETGATSQSTSAATGPVRMTMPAVGELAAEAESDRATEGPRMTVAEAADVADGVAPSPIAFETVETILANWPAFKATNTLAADAVAEAELIYQEMRHRTMASLLLKTIHTPGVQGLPGQVDTSQAVTRLLEKAIFTAVENSDVSMRGDCKGLLRDAKLLLMARRFRINEQWVELHHMLEEIELTLSNEAAAEDTASSDGEDGDDSFTSSERIPVVREYVRPIVKPVWQELQLLKFDTLFQLYLTNFRHEMVKPSTPPPPPLPAAAVESGSVPPPPPLGSPLVGATPLKPVVVATEVTQQQVDIIRTILEATEAAAHEFPSPEFARLIEAEAAALELRTFCRENPNKSPQEVIHLVAQTKKRDEDAKQTSYMSLLIHEISQMSHVLDFPINLKTIHREIVKGQKYFSCPIGQLEIGLIDMEVITMAYNAAIPSLELFGTENDQVFMKLADAVIKLRSALARNGLNSAILVLDTNEEVLSHPLTRDEVDRLRIEKENHEAGRLMELGLKTGRYIDVLAIARMVHNYERRMAAKQSPPPVVDNHPLANFGPEAKRASRRLQRVSQQVRSSATVGGSQDELDSAPYDQETTHAPRRSRAVAGTTGASGTKAGSDKRRSVQVEEGTVSEEFVEAVFKSINALNRAIAIADQVRVRSANTEFYLNGVHVILRLRELTVSDNWDEVKRYVNDDTNWQNLPNTALEELRACREGLLYQQHIVRMSQALCQGAIGGLPHEIDYDQISCDALIASLRACDEVQFSDPSAQLLIEFAQRIVTVRHLLLTDQWLDESAATKPDTALSLETPSKLRKSIYSHPTPKKTQTQRETVESSVQDYLQFFAYAVPKLQRLLRVASQIDGEGDLDFTSFLQEVRLHLGYYGSSAGSSPRSSAAMDPDGWILQIWHAVMHVVLEVNLAQQVIQYRSVLIHMIEAADTVPDMVRAYVLDRAHLHANVHPLLRSSHHHEDITLYGAGSASNLGSYAVGGSISFDTTALEESLQRAKDYLSYVGFETSEEMLKLQETCKLLIDFRNALNAQESHDSLLQLLARAKALSAKGFLSTESGVFEINAYLASTTESERIQKGLAAALQSHGVRGPLNALDRAAVDATELQRMIDDALRYLGRGGAALSVGIPTLLLQARVIHKLRTTFVDHAWSALEYTLKTYDTQAADWDVARDEFRHIQHAFAFRTAMNHIRKFVADFTSEKDLGHSLMCMEVDLRELNGIFVEVNRLLHYHSPLLVTAADSSRNPEEAVESPEVVLTEAFFKHPGVVATVALWKLCQALQVNAWYDKQAIHDNEEQQVADHPDPFLFAFFGIANANYVHRVRHGLTPSDITEGFLLSNLARKETVFSVLTATNWSGFPYNVRMFFNRVRNRLIDRFVRADLKYYCKKGATAMDGAGNLVLSNMTLQFLKITLTDAQRAVDTARRFGVPFEWTPETKKWVASAETALKYRLALTSSKNAADTVISLLRADGMMRGHTQFVPRLFSIHTELEVLEKFGQAHLAETVAAAALQFIASQSVASESKFSEVALENEAVLQLFEMAAAPVPVADPSAYLLDMLSIVGLTRDAVFATMLGGEVRLASIAEDLVEAVAFHQSPVLRAIDMARVVKFLTAACRKAYHADLLGFTADSAAQTVPQRRVARVHTVLGTRATARYLGPGAIVPPTPSKASPTAAGRVFPTLSVLDEELTGVAKLAAFTQKILTALCEVLFFHRGDDHITVGTKEVWLDQLRKKVPMGLRSQTPLHCYLSLRKLAETMDELYVAYQPLWAATLHLALYYLERELSEEVLQGDASTINVAQSIDLSQNLIQLCQDVQLDRAVLAEHVRETTQPRRRNGRPVPSRVVGGESEPSAFVLVKHLTAIKSGVNSNGQTEALAQLQRRLHAMLDSATEAQSHMASLSLENEVVGALSTAQMKVLKDFPMGAVYQAVSQCNMLLRAAL